MTNSVWPLLFASPTLLEQEAKKAFEENDYNIIKALKKLLPEGWHIENTGGHVYCLFKDFELYNVSDKHSKAYVCIVASPQGAGFYYDSIDWKNNRLLTYQDYCNGHEGFFTKEYECILFNEDGNFSSEEIDLELELDDLQEIRQVIKIFQHLEGF